MDEGNKGVGQHSTIIKHKQTSNSGPPKAEVTINDLPLAVLPLIFNNLSPLTKLKTLTSVSKPFRLATQQKAAWTSVEAIFFTKNELDLNDPLKIKLPFTSTVSLEQIEQYKRLIGWLSQIRSIRPADTNWDRSNTLIAQLNLFTLRKHIGTLQWYDKTVFALSTNVSDDQMLEINLLHQGQVKLTRIYWSIRSLVGGTLVDQRAHEYNRLLSELSCSVMHVDFDKGPAAHLDSEFGRSFQGMSIPALSVKCSEISELQSFVDFLNGLKAGSLKELRLVVTVVHNHDANAHIYKRINNEQLQSLKQLSIMAFRLPDALVKITLPVIVSKTPNLECIKLRYRHYDRLNDLIIALWQLRIGRDTDFTQTELTIVLPDVSKFANIEQVRADLNSRLKAAENGVGLGGGLTFATAQIDQLLENEWRVRIWEARTNTELSLRFVQQQPIKGLTFNYEKILVAICTTTAN